MKKLFIILATLIFLTGCTPKNGNSVSKLETTIYRTNNHDELIIEEGVRVISKEFTDKDTFYYSSLLTVEYGVSNTLEIENKIKEETNSYDVLYFHFSFKTGDVAYAEMESNHIYDYETILIKSYAHDSWHIYKMDGIQKVSN